MDLADFVKENFRKLEIQQPRLWASGDLRDISYSADFFDTHAEVEQESFWFSHRNKVFLSSFHRHSMGTPFIDIGGGTGVVSGYFNDNGVASIIVEPLQSGAQIAYDRGLFTIQSTLEKSGVRSGSLPTIGMFDVLEHIKDDEAALDSILYALAPGGHLMIAVPAYQWLWSDEDRHAGHFRRYTKRTLVDLLQSAGFEIIEANYLFSFLILPIFLLRTIPSLGGRITTEKPAEASNSKEIHSLGGIVARTFEGISNREHKRLEERKSIPFGTSVFVVAKKPSYTNGS